jgi:hypothetical protein
MEELKVGDGWHTTDGEFNIYNFGPGTKTDQGIRFIWNNPLKFNFNISVYEKNRSNHP